MRFFQQFTLAGILAVFFGQAIAAPLVIDDEKLFATLAKGLGSFADHHNATSGDALAKACKDAPAGAAVDLPRDLPAAKDYETRAQSVYLIGSVYKCPKCEQWHLGPNATAWCLTEDGLMITNYHVFEKATGDSWGVCGVNGKVYRVTEILAANKGTDLALFRVDAKGLAPLPLGDDAAVGEKVTILSHPDHRCYYQTSGEVARYAKGPRKGGQGAVCWMSVTAEFAKGSSGGPVMNADGAVVGMVSSTQSIYYGTPAKTNTGGPSGQSNAPTVRDPGPFQMVIRNCVPVSAMRALTREPVK